MKINPITENNKFLFPTAAFLTGCTMLSACRQQTPPIMEDYLNAGIYQQQQPVMGVAIGTFIEKPTEQDTEADRIRCLLEAVKMREQQKKKQP